MLQVNKISKSFHQLNAVKNLSFTLAAGEVLGIVGQNGAGKTTTFKMLLDFIAPDTGSITFSNHPLTQNSIGYLPEERGLYLNFTIAEQVRYFANLHAYPTAQVEQELPLWLARLQVKGTLKTKIKDLSKGNQQKVQLITALIHRPQLIILDEPFSGLDPVNIALLIKTIQNLKKEGAAIIFSSHNMKNVEAVSDKLMMLINGKRVLYGGIETIKQQFTRREVYLEGIFDSFAPYDLGQVIKVRDDQPGKILTFENQAAALAAIDRVKQLPDLTGFRLLKPSLDDIFRLMIQKEKEER